MLFVLIIINSKKTYRGSNHTCVSTDRTNITVFDLVAGYWIVVLIFMASMFSVAFFVKCKLKRMTVDSYKPAFETNIID